MTVSFGQPKVRFSDAGPLGVQGLSIVPKVIAVKKVIGTATENDDFWSAPAGTFISRVMCIVTDAGTANTTVSVGLDGDAEAFISSTDLTMETLNSFASNVGSTTCTYPAGVYLPAGDTLRIAVGDTPVASEIEFLIEYFEMANIFTSPHFSL